MVCPFCASENIFYSKKRAMYFCEDCEKGFEQPAKNSGTRIFISYGHDKNSVIVSKIKEYLSKTGYDVWIDTSEIAKGRDWREQITNGLLGSNNVISFLSKHSVRDPGVCIDELKIAVCLKHAFITPVLLESEDDVKPPKLISDTQWVDLSDWGTVSESEWDSYFDEKMKDITAALSNETSKDYNKEMELLSQRLSVGDTFTKELQLLKQSFIGRHWLSEKVQDWLDKSTSNSMMIFGVPGAGKSAFSANLAHFNPNVIGSIFFEWDNTSLSTPDYVSRLLAYKIASRLPDFRRILCNLLSDSDTAKEILSNYHSFALFDYLVLNPLQCCIDGNRETKFLIFDGLDETSDEVSDLLMRKVQYFPKWLKVLFTSRFNETDITSCNIRDIVHLDDSSELNTKDIELFFKYNLQLNDNDTRCSELAEKCEGSFMYAHTLCDAIYDKSFSLDEATSLPFGINAFYSELFNRLFSDYGNYTKVRSFLELLAIEDELPEELIRKCLSLDKYDLWELRTILKSLVISGTSDCFYKFKIFKFVHKSIKDWLTAPELSGKFCIFVTNGYNALVNLNSENQSESLTFEDKEVKGYYNRLYPKWLIRATRYDEYRDMLLQSFDSAAMLRDVENNGQNYTQYYSICFIWEYADLLPKDYKTDKLVQKLTEIVTFPQKLMCSNFSHRSLQIIALIFHRLIKTPRFVSPFFEFLSRLQYDGYFRSRASDDFETRDGWDKYYMTLHCAAAMKACENLGVSIPKEAKRTCERMKLSYNYYKGENKGMFISSGGPFNKSWRCGILSEPSLFKDVCILNDEEEIETCGYKRIKEDRALYNSLSLLYYLTNSDEQDVEFIKLCCSNLADINVVSEQAISEINQRTKELGTEANLLSAANRIEFINSVRKAITKS